MKNVVLTLVLVIFTCISNAAEQKIKIAMLISGYASQGNAQLSYDLEELAQSYLVLSSNGVDIDIISPAGGPVLVKDNKDHLDFIQEFKNNTPALAKLANTTSAEAAQVNHYDALMVIGGNGAVFDLPVDQNTQSFVQGFVDSESPIAAVCHGPAALLNIKTKEGKYFISGKVLNSFTAVEDRFFKKEIVNEYPFIVQEELEKRGANFVNNAPMLPYVAIDENLITAQNPMSVPKAAEALLLKLGLTPVQRKTFKDEASMALLSRARIEGTHLIDLALATGAENFDMNYLALYGFYAFDLAMTSEDMLRELALKEKIAEYFKHPQYQLSLINAYAKLGKTKDAKAALRAFVQDYPKEEIPESLQQQLD